MAGMTKLRKVREEKHVFFGRKIVQIVIEIDCDMLNRWLAFPCLVQASFSEICGILHD